MISKMRYDSLIRRSIIPDLDLVTEKIPVTRYPQVIISTKRYAFFGMFFEHVLKKYYSCIRFKGEKARIVTDYGTGSVVYQNYVDCSKEEVFQHANLLTAEQLNLRPFSQNELAKIEDFVIGRCKTMTKQWKRIYGQKLYFGMELTNGQVQGHPDLVTDTTVFDVKCGCTTKQTRKESFLQILAYWALHPTLTKIGLILPMCGKYIVYDLSGYSKSLFLHELKQIAEALTRQQQITLVQEDIYKTHPLGHHISIGDGIQTRIEAWCERNFQEHGGMKPCQIYLDNPRTCKVSQKTISSLQAAGEIVQSLDLHLYIHMPQAMNIGNPDLDYCDLLKERLQQANALNAKGIVVHAGRHAKHTRAVALQKQLTTIRSVLPFVGQCRILIETPCGEAGDLCNSFEEMHDFFAKFNDDELTGVGICIDTCHVYNAGINPLCYFEKWLLETNFHIGLCHYNDAKNLFGVGVEGHHPFFTPGGSIGWECMKQIADLCKQNGIDMVVE